MKIGFFGGSFDPPHRGHIALARLAIQRLSLDRVLFAPVGMQPLKRDRPTAGFDDRIAMTTLAIDGQPAMEISRVDAPRSDGRPNYTIDTVRTLRTALPGPDQLFCLMGADSFLSIGRWHRAADLLVTCDFVVAARPGFDLGRIAAALPATVSVAATDAPYPGCLALSLHHGGNRASHLYLLPDLAEEVSASAIRAALTHHSQSAHNSHPDSAIDPRVAAYIRGHGLYRMDAAS
jgi:nicotinate-nucleotide adenylyltransferase